MLDTSLVGLDEFEAKINGFVAALDVTGIVDEIAAAMLARTRARFLEQVSPDGVAWIPSFAAIRRALHGSGGGTLFDTGRLFHSIQVYLTDDHTRSIGTDVEYAPKHQFGLEGMVKREFLGFGDDDIALANAIANNRVRLAMKGPGA